MRNVLTTSTLRTAALALGLATLAACDTTGGAPRSTDEDGRAVVTADQAVQSFLDVCYATRAEPAAVTRALAKAGGFDAPSERAGFSFVKHTTLAMDAGQIAGSSCWVSFETGRSNVSSGVDAAELLLARVPHQKVGGTLGGGEYRITTTRGDIAIGNKSRVYRSARGVTITLITEPEE